MSDPRLRALMATALAVLIRLPQGWAAPASESANLVRNSSFEEGDDAAAPQNWGIYWFWTGAGWSAEREAKIESEMWQTDRAVARSGKRSAKIRHHHFYNRVDMAGGYAQKRLALAKGQRTYTLSAYVKASKPTKCQLFLWGHVADWGPEYDGAPSRSFTVGPKWQRLSHTVTFGPEIQTASVLVLRERNVLGGDLWVDDVQLEAGESPTAYASDVGGRRGGREE